MSGRARVLALDDVNTDQIHLAIYSHLPIEEQAQHCLETVAPGFASSVVPGDLLVAGRNFGCGSARPAQLDFIQLGLAGIVAESIDRKFFGNAVSSGFPTITCPGVLSAVAEGDRVTFDTRSGTFDDLTSGYRLTFAPLPDFLSDMLEAGGEFASLTRLFARDASALGFVRNAQKRSP